MTKEEKLNRESIKLGKEIDYLDSIEIEPGYKEIEKAIGREISKRLQRINEIEAELGQVTLADLI